MPSLIRSFHIKFTVCAVSNRSDENNISLSNTGYCSTTLSKITAKVEIKSLLRERKEDNTWHKNVFFEFFNGDKNFEEHKKLVSLKYAADNLLKLETAINKIDDHLGNLIFGKDLAHETSWRISQKKYYKKIQRRRKRIERRKR